MRIFGSTLPAARAVKLASRARADSHRSLPAEERGLKIGIFLPNWVGDVAMCTPTLRALRRHFGSQARLIGVVRPSVADVLAGTPWLDEQLLFDRKSSDPGQHAAAVGRALRQRKVDTVVLLNHSLRSALIAWRSGARQRAGYVRRGRGLLLTHKLYPARLGHKRLPVPAIDEYLQLAYALGAELESPRLELATLPADEAAADAVWRKWNLPGGEQVVVLNSGGAYGAAKLWPSEHFADLARRIVTQSGFSVLVTCGPAEREVARQIVARARHPRVVSLADELLSIGLTKACIRRGRLLVTTDSGPRFFGVAFGLPVISLFGPTDPAWTRTHYAGETVLSHAISCRPCGRRTCPLGHHDCLRKLSVERVYAAVREKLEEPRSVQAA
jgi:heptosyltransferase-2